MNIDPLLWWGIGFVSGYLTCEVVVVFFASALGGSENGD